MLSRGLNLVLDESDTESQGAVKGAEILFEDSLMINLEVKSLKSNRNRSSSKPKSSASKTLTSRRDKSELDMFNADIAMSNVKSIDFSAINDYGKHAKPIRSSSAGDLHELIPMKSSEKP